MAKRKSRLAREAQRQANWANKVARGGVDEALRLSDLFDDRGTAWDDLSEAIDMMTVEVIDDCEAGARNQLSATDRKEMRRLAKKFTTGLYAIQSMIDRYRELSDALREAAEQRS